MKHEGDQSIFKNEVKQWLKSLDLDYKWMAEQCGVSEITVRNWMSQKTIPPLKQQLIERVMAQMPAIQSTTTANNISGVQVNASLSLNVKLSPEIYSQLEAKAAKQGVSLGDMVARAITHLIKGESTSALSLKPQKVILSPSKSTTP